jgi:hypothetical protein
MVQKRLLCPAGVRKIPKQFSWIDQRLVRDHHIDLCSHRAAALYLFLATVADAQGLSYYSDRCLCRRLAMDDNTLTQARQELIGIGLIAHQTPLYQVLAIESRPSAAPIDSRTSGGLHTLGQIFKKLGEATP